MEKSKAAGDGKKEELRHKIEYRVRCEERAHKIVERLIENPVTEQLLLESLPLITSNHYEDIVVERAVSKLCGYPLCTNTLQKVLKQKFMISTKTNKVYDVEARKDFCSNKCYKASKHLLKQVSNDPVWMRIKKSPQKYQLLPLGMKIGRVGDEIEMSDPLNSLGDAVRELDIDDAQDGDDADINNDVDGLTGNGDSSAVHRIHQDLYGDISGETKTNTAEKSPIGGRSNTEHRNVVGKQDTGVANQPSASNQPTGVTNNRTGVSNQETGVTNQLSASNQATGVTKLNQSSIHSDISSETQTSSQAKPSKRNVSAKKGKGRESKTGEKSKTDYLMELLDRKKSLLAKMVDIQPTETSGISENVENPGNSETTTRGSEVVGIPEPLENPGKVGEIEHAIGTSCGEIISNRDVVSTAESVETTETEGNICEKRTPENVANSVDVVNTSVGVQIVRNIKECKVDSLRQEREQPKQEREQPKQEHRQERQQSSQERQQPKQELRDKPSHQPKPITRQEHIPTMLLLCQSIRAWLTQDSMDYLNKKADGDGGAGEEGTTGNNTEFSRQYKALVAKMDAQDKDFDAFLGEESLDSAEDQTATAPLPHFDVLKTEMEDHQLRVKEFMKGSYTFKTVQETPIQETSKAAVYLPTVDRYDQLLIRQKLVLDRISKALPDLLSPLHLLTQDVFTEIRELVFTFNLTSDNILYKPPEWSVITLILLKMLCGKIPLLVRAFQDPGAVKYLTILLSGLGANTATLDRQAELLCHVKS